MINYMKQVTPEMTAIVNDLKRRNFEGATPDEIETYANWKSIMTLQSDEMEQLRQKRQEETESRKKAIKEESDKAMNVLNELSDLAKARLKVFENER